MSSDFYDANSHIGDMILEDKSPADIDEDIALCDSCSNIILVPYQDNKLICTRCGNIYDPHYELVQIQDKETTLDELSSQGELGYKDESKKPISKTLNHKEARLENIEYVKKEVERYRQIEIIDKDVITNKISKRPKVNNNE